MATYKAPLRDMRFVLNEVLGGCEAHLEHQKEMTADLVDQVLEEAAKVAEEVLQPLNRTGDEEGCTFENGVVHTPKGFKEAYRTYREGGWTAIASDPAYGGQGMPHVVDTLVGEMICAANLSFSMYPGLTQGGVVTIVKHGSAELKSRFLPKMIDGTWAGTMCLTEPHCGTDLGLLRTKAEPAPNGAYKISGTKIFISAGDHDLTDNIIHLVLARLPDAPKGVKGISLFLVPKFLVNADGTLGQRNGVTVGSIEHKMGIKASSTCVMNFDSAEGYLVGEPHKGMRAMFSMMNTERVAVGVSGLGIAEASYQGAVSYARDRLQGRALTGTKQPEKPADPLIVHPDVRRMLLTQRAYVEGGRALALWVAQAIDREHHPDPRKSAEAEDFVALMTPIVKALLTDFGSECANLGVQVYGGHGFIREWGMEQFVRDVRITQIYEGTNGIQALDLVGRKLPAHAGRYLRSFFHPVDAYIAEKKTTPGMAEFIEPLAKAFGRLQQATIAIATRSLANPDEAGAAATEYLRLFGLTALAYLWARMAEVALAKASGEDGAFYTAKLATARFYMQKLLPQTGALLSSILAGAKPLMAIDEAAF